ncbi:MAG: Coenzyme F420 hydrogenase/dehydrogenase, beta subunit C-terminal domain [Methanospirillum sp.]|uniref:Coenzyme F420 hydrogenase/dehydrogenase, beta subunit C-terminal domain n=1 Tax=Methanospirillum sp. TaxID=45200 RepID=UPI00237641F9|nr:Coenzyme F420 hydrogenase/dehydrogenase, beta subunit C-terminal domain [Methanospirillum sp.]MDD1728548.1 Coenzyme F420 hydrogenase/dehydrogenase, beta subunit C-terminal domain [Methanospirillum sp.]
MAEKKSYKDLNTAVWEAGTCSGCGACVAVCPADALYFIDEPGISHPTSSGYCKMATDLVPCGACYDACPRTREQKRETLGSYHRLLRAQSIVTVPHQQSGGAVTAILTAAMQEGLIDGVVTLTEDRWTHRPRSILITSGGELVEHAGSRYNWSVPVLRSLKTAIVDKKLTHIAIVGTPCVVQGARAMKDSKNDLLIPFGRSIRLIIGLFCTESFDYHVLMEDILKRSGLAPQQIEKMDVKGKLDLTLTDGTTSTLSLDEVAKAVRQGCHTCGDFSALDADIAAGSVGTPAGYTTLIVRTTDGDGFVDNAVKAGVLSVTTEVETGIIEKLAAAKQKRLD